MKRENDNRNARRISRRDILRLAVAGGVALATTGVADARAAGAEKGAADRPAYAKERFLKSMNCSQAVFETYAPAMGVPVETARKIAAAFACGMGMGSECGAVTGAFLVIGLKYGKTCNRDSSADSDTFKRVARFVKEFKTRHGHIGCSELLGCDMGTREGVKEASRKGFFTSRCPVFVQSAGEILEEIL
jgi:C_GCAxxG_C_C family probable redox protein